jgi:hypothetical protein
MPRTEVVGRVVREYQLIQEDCISCGIEFAIPEWLYDRLREKGDTFYCPQGHSMSYTKPTVQVLRDKLRAKEAELSAERDQRAAAEREVQELKAKAQRAAKRAAAGVCPCCHRTFQQLARHVKAKHPEMLKS